jgi:hypothetical protein
MKKIYIDRSRNLDYARCPRLRYNTYHEGPSHIGIQPVRKSIHLVLGGAVHVGMEHLLREGQQSVTYLGQRYGLELPRALDRFFHGSSDNPGQISARYIEDEAVKAALVDLSESTAHGVELDELEKVNTQATIEQLTKNPAAAKGESSIDCGQFGGSDSAIVIEFGDFEVGKGTFKEQLEKSVEIERIFDKWDKTLKDPKMDDDWGKPIVIGEPEAIQLGDGGDLMSRDLAAINVANADQAAGMDDYLRGELAAQVEGMVRAYARRRLRPLLEQFEVMEVEREGEWKLGEVGSVDGFCDFSDGGFCWHCRRNINDVSFEDESKSCPASAELWFMSRHDALLRERSTNFLYLLSFKTAGQWDRRKEQEAQIDMQGLSEAVDVDNRLSLAWYKIHADTQPTEDWDINNVADDNVQRWLMTLPSPPRILGVRYEYLLKGPRRQDKKDAEMPGRYVADTPLIRAYKQDGITSDDRRWAHSYDWFNLAGQGKRLDYRSWKKAPVWKSMPIAKWIDMLDAGLVQPEAYDANGHPVDVLAEQFVEPVTVFRNDDDLRDMLEQMEAQEVKVAVDVARVQAVADDAAAKRSALNRLFPQNRRSCVYPGKCSSFELCYGSQTLREDPIGSGLYQIRSVNHPQELSQ